VTLYASSRDKALALSKELHGGWRAGDSGDHIVVVPPIDTIDVSNVDTSFEGHVYFGNNASVISDLFYLIRDGKRPSERFGLVAKKLDGKPYWMFVPTASP
jgi:esterase/lipase superfamily enzyme